MSFKEKGYCSIKNFLSEEMSILLYTYSKAKVLSTEHKYINFPHLYDHQVPSWDANLNDIQSPNTFSYYGDVIMDTVLICVQKKIEEITELKLTPNYSYWRLYEEGDVLKYHKDRHSCEISATICLGFDTSNINNEKWPMFIESNDENSILSTIENIDTKKTMTIKGTPFYQNPGDIIIYRGNDFAHWREPFKGKNQAQLFLHYNDINNNNAKVLDGREIIGIPFRR